MRSFRTDDVTELCGTLDPNDVIRRLATAVPEQHVRRTQDNQGIELTEEGVASCVRIIQCGIDAERITRWINKLAKIAMAAIVADSTVSYG